MKIIKPVKWNTFWQDMLRIQLGFALFGLAISLMIRANLGTSAWAVLEVALSQILNIMPGTVTILMGFVVLSIVFILQEKIGWGTLENILCIGLWENLTLYLTPSVNDNLPLQISMLLGAIVIMGLASAIYIGVGAGAGPRDSLMLAIKRKTGLSIRVARGVIELTVVLLGWLLGGPAGIGTVVFALLIGVFVQWGFKLLKVDPHRKTEAETTDSLVTEAVIEN